MALGEEGPLSRFSQSVGLDPRCGCAPVEPDSVPTLWDKRATSPNPRRGLRQYNADTRRENNDNRLFIL